VLFLSLVLSLTSADPDFEAMKSAWNKKNEERIEFDRARAEKRSAELVELSKEKIIEAKKKRDKAIQNAGNTKGSRGPRVDAQNAKLDYLNQIEYHLDVILKEKDTLDKLVKEAVNANRNDDNPNEWRDGFFGRMSKQQFRIRSVDSKDTITATFGDKSYIVTGIDTTGATPGKAVEFSGWYYIEKPRSHPLGTFLVIRAVP
jgi:hypothetical protein